MWSLRKTIYLLSGLSKRGFGVLCAVAVLGAASMSGALAMGNRPTMLTAVQLVQTLTEGASSDVDRARRIYRWVIQNVGHDSSAARRIGDPSRHSIDELIRYGRGSCAVYAHVTEQLMRMAGLEVKSVVGWARVGEAGTPAQSHSWNLVKLNGAWHVVDATWGAGYVDGGRFVKEPSDVYFMMPPVQAALSHFDPKDQTGVQASIGMNETLFNRIPDSALNLSAQGFSATQLFEVARQRQEFVEFYDHQPGDYQVIKAQPSRHIRSGTQEFVLKSNQFEELFAVQGRQWVPFKREANGQHSLRFSAKPGELTLMGRRKGSAEYEGLLGYQVR